MTTQYAGLEMSIYKNSVGGKVKSKAKATASKENGKKGGRLKLTKREKADLQKLDGILREAAKKIWAEHPNNPDRNLKKTREDKSGG